MEPDRITIVAAKQPPLAFFGTVLLTKTFEDPFSDEPYLVLTAYRTDTALRMTKDTVDVRGEITDVLVPKRQDECLIIKKESHFDFEHQSSLIKYLVLKHPRTEAHDELYNFCMHKNNEGTSVSNDFLEFIRELGQAVANDPFYYYNNQPWRLAK
jgi:hypothetical protein